MAEISPLRQRMMEDLKIRNGDLAYLAEPNTFPRSHALADSIVAFKAGRLIWQAMFWIADFSAALDKPSPSAAVSCEE